MADGARLRIGSGRGEEHELSADVLEEHRALHLECDADGAFEVDGLPPGEHELGHHLDVRRQ